MQLGHLTKAQIRNVISRAAAVNAAFPQSSMGADDSTETVDDELAYGDSAEYRALEEAISSLSDDARHELRALMWLGRGDRGNDFQMLRKEARDKSSNRDVEYIAANAPTLPDYLKKGLALINAQEPQGQTRPTT